MMPAVVEDETDSIFVSMCLKASFPAMSIIGI